MKEPMATRNLPPGVELLVKGDSAARSFCARLQLIAAGDGSPPVLLLDKDGTLTPPRKALDHEAARALLDLEALGAVIAVISGAEFARLRTEVFEMLRARGDLGGRFYFVAENGAQIHQSSEGDLKRLDICNLEASIGPAHFATLLAIVEEARLRFGIGADPDRKFVVLNPTQVKLSGLGNIDDPGLRATFDPVGARRAEWARFLRMRIAEAGIVDAAGPMVDVVVAGTSSVNLLARGVNKGRAVERLLAICGATPAATIYFGDNFSESGNDSFALRSVGTAVNFGAPDVNAPADGTSMVINALQKGPDGVRRYLNLAVRLLGDLSGAQGAS